jgi:hypothetical protein
MGKSDIKVINIKNFKLEESERSEQERSGGEDERIGEQSEEFSEFNDENNEEFSEFNEENNEESEQERSGGDDDFTQEEKLDPFLLPAKGGFDEDFFNDESLNDESLNDESLASESDGEIQQAGRRPSISDSIIEELSGDPMLLVLTRFLISKKGNSIADILEEIKDHLAFIRAQITLKKN